MFPHKPLKPNTPLYPLNPETLYCASVRSRDLDESLDGFRQRLTSPAYVYANKLKDVEGLLLSTAGLSDLSPLLIDRLAADWSSGQKMKPTLNRMQTKQTTWVFERPKVPFVVMVDEDGVPPELIKMFPKPTKPGQSVGFKLTLQRQFGTQRRLKPEIQLVEEWCKLGGMKPLLKWLRENQDNPKVYDYYYDTGKPKDVLHEVEVLPMSRNWKLDGEWPRTPVEAPVNRRTAKGPIPIVRPASEWVTKQSSPFRRKDYQLRLTPEFNAGPMRVNMEFRFTDTFGIEPPKGAATASPAKPVTEPPKEPEPTTYRLALRLSIKAAPAEPPAPPTAPRNPPPVDPPSRPPNPTATKAAPCEADYQAAVARIRAKTLWNFSGLGSSSDGCPTAESVFDACYRTTCQMYRDSGIYNPCTDACKATFTSACTTENLTAAAATRDKCLGSANTEGEVQKARDQAAVALQKAREGQRARELAQQAQIQAEQLARQQEADRLRKIEEEKRAAEWRAREQAQQAESQQARRWEELQRQGAAQAALDRQREIDAQRRKAEEADARRRADAERRQRAEEDRAELDARNRPPASDPAPPRVPQVPTPSPPPVPPVTAVPPPPPVSTALDYAPVCESAMTAIELRHKAVNGPAANPRVEWKRRFRADNGDCVGGAYILWVTDATDNKDYRTLEWHLDDTAGTERVPASAFVNQFAKEYPALHWTPTTPPGQTPPARTPPPTAPPGQQQPPCPPAPLPGLANQQTNLRCFGIPGPGQ